MRLSALEATVRAPAVSLVCWGVIAGTLTSAVSCTVPCACCVHMHTRAHLYIQTSTCSLFAQSLNMHTPPPPHSPLHHSTPRLCPARLRRHLRRHLTQHTSGQRVYVHGQLRSRQCSRCRPRRRLYPHLRPWQSHSGSGMWVFLICSLPLMVLSATVPRGSCSLSEFIFIFTLGCYPRDVCAGG